MTKLQTAVKRAYDSRDLQDFTQQFLPVQDQRVTPQSKKQEADHVSGGIGSLAKAEIRYLSAIIASLVELRNGPESDDHGVLKPTRVAFLLTSDLLVDSSICAAIEHKSGVPLGYVSTDDKGGVRVEWMSDDAAVFLIVSSTGESAQIYREKGDKYETIDATAEELAESLRYIKW